MKDFTSFYYFHNSKADTINVVLHGSSKGIESLFIEKVFKTFKDLGQSVISFNFPYLERGQESTSGTDLKEEVDELKKILTFADASKYKHIRLVGKSLGAIVVSFYLKSLPQEEQKRYSVIVLGYVKSETGIDLRSFSGRIVVVQGEKDQLGNIEVVREDLKDAMSDDIQYFGIKGADHSYRDPDTKEPIYEDEVIEILQSLKS